MKVIEKLDRRPPLVAIQVLIAQVSLKDQFDLGTELGLQDALLFDRRSATGGTFAFHRDLLFPQALAKYYPVHKSLDKGWVHSQ